MMGMIRAGIRRLFHLSAHGDATRDAAMEAETHIALRTEQLIARGYTPEAASAEAHRRFGDPHFVGVSSAATARERRVRVRHWLEGFQQDVAFSVRSLRREPLLTAFIVLTFALGIGANAAMFGVVDRLLLQGPEHVKDAHSLKRLYAYVAPKGWRAATTGTFGYVTYGIMRESARVFEGVAAYHIDPDGGRLGRGESARSIDVGVGTADLFPLLGVQPYVGRFFSADEDKPGAGRHVIVLGYGLWQREFGGSRDVIGQSISISDESYEIIGVAPRGFTGPELSNVDAWVPMSTYSEGTDTDWPHSWQAQWLQIIGRVKPGLSDEQVNADITAAFVRAYTGDESGMREAKISARPLIFNESGAEPNEVRIARWLFAVAVIVLIIACSNVANLLLARAIRRRREVAVRVALGAGGSRLLRLLVTESLMLAGVGAAASCIVAYISAQLIRTTLLPNIEWISSPVSIPVLMASATIAMVVGVAVGLVPALHMSRRDMTSALKTGAREGGGHAWRLRGVLTVAQAALCVLLLVGAGLFMRSLVRAQHVDLGIKPDRVLVSRFAWAPLAANATPEARMAERARRIDVYRQALTRVRTLPGVAHASLSVGLPFDLSFSQLLRVPGRDSVPRLKSGGPRISAVTNDYFATVGTPLLRGRAFTESDNASSEPVTIVSALMATTVWPGDDPIGKCLYTGNGDVPCSRIVGVAGDAHRSSLREDPGMHYYVPYGQERQMGGTKLLVQPAGDMRALITPLARLVHEIDPSVSVVSSESLQNQIEPQMRPWRLGASVLGLMGVLALIVASIGLYSVMSYLVVQRTHELGVRAALGASSAQNVGLVMRGGIRLAAVGVVLGLAAALPLGTFAAPLLFETSPRDGLVYVAVAMCTLCVALIATLVPALRAKRISPLLALRSE